MIYIDSPLSYMVEGMAKKFYQGMAGVTNDVTFDDPSVINYFVIEPLYQCSMDEDGSPNYHDQDSEVKMTFNGTRLVGMIPCSDAFGVDLIIDDYNSKVEQKE